MLKKDNRYIEIFVGMAAATLPFMLLAYKFGFRKTVAIFIVVISSFVSAKLAIYLFTRRSKVAKAGAIVIQGNLIFLLFMPKALKQKMRSLKEKEQTVSNKGKHRDG